MTRQAATVAAVAAAVIVVALLVLYLYPRDTAPPDRGDAAVTDIERGDTAREAIAELQAEADGRRIDLDAAFDRAEAFREEGRLADAQLLYFFAARGGHAPSAFALGTMNDPLHHAPETSLLPEPDPFQAYKWYAQAREGGVSAAAGRLDALHAWAQREARGNNAQAEQLLMQWD